MKIRALQEYTDQYISIFEDDVREVNDPLAEKLIEDGIVAEETDEEEEEENLTPGSTTSTTSTPEEGENLEPGGNSSTTSTTSTPG